MQPPFTAEMLLAHGEWLRRLAAYLLRDAPDADDVVQETWEAALRSPPDPQRPVRPWLAQILRNAIRSTARASSRRAARERIAAPAVGDATAEDLLARMRLQERIARLMVALEEPYRTTLLLRFYDGRDATEIARTCQVPAGTVRWRISEGIRRLRERLDQDLADRGNWRALLAPLAVSGSAARPGRGTVTAATPRRWPLAIAGGLALSGALVLRAVAPAVFPRDDQRLTPMVTSIDRSTKGAKTEVTIMSGANVKQVAAFLGVALPALVATAAPPAFTGKPVDLQLTNAKIHNVLRLLSEVGQVNIWTSDQVKGEVTVKVKSVPWDQVIDQICRERGLYWQRNDNVILISTTALGAARPYFGKRIAPDFNQEGKAVDIRVAMAALAQVGRVTIEVADDVDATVSMRGREMPWDQILDVVLWTKNLRAERRGDVIRVHRGH